MRIKIEKNVKLPITERALIQRVNRKLGDNERVRKPRAQSAKNEVGDYYIVDSNTNTITATHVDLEALGRELGVLLIFETLIAE